MAVLAAMSAGTWVSRAKGAARTLPPAEVRQDGTPQRNATLVVTVMDEQGQAIQGADIDAVPGDGQRAALNRVRTDGNGMATITVAASKTPCVVAASNGGFAPAHATVTPESADAPVDVYLALTKGHELQGIIMCSDGKPAAGWSVYVQPEWWKSPYMPKDVPIGKDGQFTIPHVGDGEHQIHLLRGNSSRMIGTVSMPAAQMPIRLDVPFVSLASRTDITGKVSIKGRPSSSILVIAQAGDEHLSGQVDFGRDSNSTEGTYTIKAAAPGAYRLSFSAPEVEPKVLQNVKIPGKVPPVQLVVSGKPVLHGVVTDAATGKPITHFAMRVDRTEDPKWSQVANNEGQFRMELPGPGIYRAQVVADGYASMWSEGLRVEATGAVAEWPVKLTAGGALSGLVVDPQGKPVVGAKVIPFSMARNRLPWPLERFQGELGAAVTDANGRFVLPHLAPGDERLKVVYPQLAPRVVDGLKVVEGKETDIGSVSLATGGTVEGTVYDSEGYAAPGVTLRFKDYEYGADLEALRVATVMTDEEGHYRVEHLASERLYVNVADWNRQGVQSRLVRPLDGKVTTLDFGGTVAVRGRLMDKSRPIAGRRVRLSWGSPHGGPVTVTASTDRDGRFAFLGTPVGKYTLCVQTEDGRGDFIPAGAGEVQVTGKETNLGDVKIATGEVIVEVDAEERGDADHVAYLSVANDDPRSLWQEEIVQAKRDGDDWRARSVPAGKYRVFAQFRGDTAFVVQMPFEQKADRDRTKLKLRIPRQTATLEATVIAPDTDDSPFYRELTLLNADQTVMVFAYSNANPPKPQRLPPGEYRVMDTATAKPRADVPPIVLQAGKTTQVTIHAVAEGGPPTTLVVVQVWSAEGLPAPESPVRLVDSDGTSLQTVRIHEGVSVFAARPGKYRVEVDVPGRTPVTRDIEVAAFVPTAAKPAEEVHVVLP